MVLNAIIALGLIGLAIFYRNEIADILRGAKKTAEFQKDPVAFTASTTGRAIEETFGTQALENLKSNITLDPSIAQKQIADFTAEAQKTLQTGVTGVNLSLLQAQQNLESFAQKTKQEISKSVSETQRNIEQSLAESAKQSEVALQDIQAGFTQAGAQIEKAGQDVIVGIQSFFGGQQKPKPVFAEIPKTPKAIETDTGGIIDLSFLTPSTSFKETKQQEEEVKATQQITQRKAGVFTN